MEGTSKILPAERFDVLFEVLKKQGFDIWGVHEKDDALTLAPIDGPADLPRGRIDDTGPGKMRLIDGSRDAYFDHTLPMQGLKRLVYPPQDKVFETGEDYMFTEPPVDAKPIAVIGARSCDLVALETLADVLENGPYPDHRFAERRQALFLVAVNCTRAAKTCFCTSMNSGPRAESGYDLALTELFNSDGHRFLIEAGGERGQAVLDAMSVDEATDKDRHAANIISSTVAASMTRSIPDDARETLKSSYDHPQWSDIGERCMDCANCTLVCPTCLCSTIEDRSSLDGSIAERWRRWDSCFIRDFSYIHGGVVRKETASRYRQWMTHKLTHWHDQFGRSGCVGCGRCIAWCPVGIDITAEIRAISKTGEAVVEAGVS